MSSMTHSKPKWQFVFLASLFAVTCRGASRQLFANFSWMYMVLLSFFLFSFFSSAVFIAFSLVSSTVPSLGSFVFPLSSPASLKALSTSGYKFDKLEFSFPGVLVVSSAVLMHWLLIIAFLQDSGCTLSAPTYLILCPSLKYTRDPNSLLLLRTVLRQGKELSFLLKLLSHHSLFFSFLFITWFPNLHCEFNNSVGDLVYFLLEFVEPFLQLFHGCISG